MTSELITFNHLRCHSSSQQHWELELVTESQLGKVQKKAPFDSAHDIVKALALLTLLYKYVYINAPSENILTHCAFLSFLWG